MMFRFLSLISLFVAVSSANAHPIHLHEFPGAFETGMAHPWTGIDHLLAMVLVGVLAMQLRTRSKWTLPALFCCSMAVCAVAGYAIGTISRLEIGLAITLVAFGSCLLVRQVPHAILLAIVLIGGSLHGLAHGAALNPSDVSVGYLAGMILGTAMLHLAGMGIAFAFNQTRHQSTWVRVSGTLACAIGIALLVGIV